jgi:hypothetical protein
MAEILTFPSRWHLASNHLADGDDAWPEDHAPGGVGLKLVATLSATPSRTIADLARKVEVLVLRLVTGDGADAGLCKAEAALLQSVYLEICKVADDSAFAAREIGIQAPVAAE